MCSSGCSEHLNLDTCPFLFSTSLASPCLFFHALPSYVLSSAPQTHGRHGSPCGENIDSSVCVRQESAVPERRGFFLCVHESILGNGVFRSRQYSLFIKDYGLYINVSRYMNALKTQVKAISKDNLDAVVRE